MAQERVAIGGGARGVNVHLAPADLVRALGAAVVDVTVPEEASTGLTPYALAPGSATLAPPATSRKLRVTCPACGHQNPAGMKFCGECGTRLATGCPTCGFQNPPGMKFCGECGDALARGGRRA